MEINDIDIDNIDALHDEVSNYNTDSDIDDPKYTPTYSTIYKEKVRPGNRSEVSKSLEEKLKFMNNTKPVPLGDYEHKLSSYEAELHKVKDKLAAKENILSEFQLLSAKSAGKFKLLEAKNEQLVKTNEDLMKKVKEYENQVKELKEKNEESEALKNSIQEYQEKIEKIENESQKKEEILRKKYEEREENIKTEYLLEITKLTKEIEELRVDNEKQKFEISTLKMSLTNESSNHENKQYETISLLTQKEKEISFLQDKLKEYDSQINDTDRTVKEKEELLMKELDKLKEENESAIFELNHKNDMITELQTAVDDLNQKIESLSEEIEQNSTTIANKDAIISKIKKQNENLQKDIEDRENEIFLLEQSRQSEANDYTAQIEALLKEKNDLDIYKQELTDNLYQANNKIKEMHEFISEKYNSLIQSLSSETQKNEELEKKYKKIVKNLRYKLQSVIEENRTLRNVLNAKDKEKEQMEYHYQNELKNMSLYNNTIYQNNNSIGNGNEVESEDEQKVALEDFKRLLSKIDEKLDIPVKQNY